MPFVVTGPTRISTMLGCTGLTIVQVNKIILPTSNLQLKRYYDFFLFVFSLFPSGEFNLTCKTTAHKNTVQKYNA